LHDLGFGEPVSAFGAAANSGKLYSGERWSIQDHIDIGRGLGLKVTSAQLARSLVPIANGSGVYTDIRLERIGPPMLKSRLLDENVVLGIRSWLEGQQTNKACGDKAWGTGTLQRSLYATDVLVTRRDILLSAGWCRDKTRNDGMLAVVVLEFPTAPSQQATESASNIALQLLSTIAQDK
jgi:hypothetical protein